MADGIRTVTAAGRRELQGGANFGNRVRQAQMENARELAVAVLLAAGGAAGNELLPEGLPRGRQLPCRQRRTQRRGKGDGDGRLQEQRHVVAEVLDDLLTPVRAGMRGHERVASVEPHLKGVRLERQPRASVAGRDRVPVGVVAYAAGRAHHDLAPLADLDRRCWERSQRLLFHRQRRRNGLVTSGHDALLVLGAAHAQPGVEVVQARHPGEGHKVGAAGIAHQVLDAAFLPAGRRLSENGLEAVGAVKVAEGVLLFALVPSATEDARDRRRQIVVDPCARQAAPELEGVALAQEEGVLAFGREDCDEPRPRVAQPSGQEGLADLLPGPLDDGMAEVELGALTGRKRQGHIARHALLLAGMADLAHQPAHRRLGDLDPHLAELHPHPPRRPALLGCDALQSRILRQPPLNVGQRGRAFGRWAGLLPLIPALASVCRLRQQARHCIT